MSADFQKIVREYEISMVIDFLKLNKPAGSRLLEIGAGGGWQAKRLSEAGFEVEAIDIDSSRHRFDRSFTVNDYDGENIPYSNESFDIIFSSNVLEHVTQAHRLSQEIKRCMRPGAIQLHLVPSASWRFFTPLNHFPFILKFIIKKFFPKLPATSQEGQSVTPAKWKWYQKLLPMKHGETGNVLTETWWFSRWGWNLQFKKWELPIERIGSNKVLYTGYGLMGNLTSLKVRHLVAWVFGSTCHIYWGKKSE